MQGVLEEARDSLRVLRAVDQALEAQPEALAPEPLGLVLLCREQMVNFQVRVLREGAEKDHLARHWGRPHRG